MRLRSPLFIADASGTVQFDGSHSCVQEPTAYISQVTNILLRIAGGGGGGSSGAM
jgi:hypothetical protein